MSFKSQFIITPLFLLFIWKESVGYFVDQPKQLDVTFGTKILMANGSEKNIKDVTLNDSVKCMDTLTHKLYNSEVTATGYYFMWAMVAISFSNGTINKNTTDQPYYIYRKGWCSIDTAETNITYGIKANLLSEGDTAYCISDGKLGFAIIKNISKIGGMPPINLGVRNGGNYFANGILVRAEGKTYHFPPYSKVPHKILIKIHLTVNNHVQNNKINAFTLSDSLENIQPTTYVEHDTSREFKTDSSYQSILNLKDSNSIPFRISFTYRHLSFQFPLTAMRNVHLVTEIDYYIDIGKIESTKEKGIFLCNYEYSKERLYGKYELFLGEDPVWVENGKIKCYKK